MESGWIAWLLDSSMGTWLLESSMGTRLLEYNAVTVTENIEQTVCGFFIFIIECAPTKGKVTPYNRMFPEYIIVELGNSSQ